MSPLQVSTPFRWRPAAVSSMLTATLINQESPLLSDGGLAKSEHVLLFCILALTKFHTLLSEFGLLSRGKYKESDFACSRLHWIRNVQFSVIML